MSGIEKSKNSMQGFTLVELLIGMVVAGIATMATYSVYVVQQDQYKAQSQVTEMQQNLRSARTLLPLDFRRVGYDPTNAKKWFEIRDIGKDADGVPIFEFSYDNDENGELDEPGEVITYSLYDFPITTPAERDGILDFGVDRGAGRQLVAESIEAWGLAYAFDEDNDKELDLSANNNIIWAIDSDNNDSLDKILDTNDDGLIDNDDTAGGVALASGSPGLDDIRAVRVWMLARSKTPDKNYSSQPVYVVGEQHISPNDNVRRRLYESIFYFRNLGI